MAGRQSGDHADPMVRLSSVIAAIAFKDAPSDEAALRLDTLGFTAKEIGAILGKNENYLHMVKNARKVVKKGTQRGKARKNAN